LEAAESHLRLHIRPYFGRRPLGTISAQVVQRWQNELERRASHNLTMACRSILNRILEAAEAERLIPGRSPCPSQPSAYNEMLDRAKGQGFTLPSHQRGLLFLSEAGVGMRTLARDLRAHSQHRPLTSRRVSA
jgi:hypothetical protein